MPKTFSKNILYTIFIFTFTIFAIFGLHVNFITYIDTNNYILFISVLFGVIAITPAFILDLNDVVLKTYNPFKKSFAFLFFLILSSACSWAIIKYSLPIIYTQMFGKHHVDYDFVLEIHNPRFANRFCGRNIRLKRWGEIMCVSDNYILRLKIDDELKLSGKKTKFGFRVFDIEKININYSH